VSVYYAWPKKGDDRRIVAGPASPSTSTSASSGSGTTATGSASPAPSKIDGSILTAAGYIVNRERIEISPRFLGLVKWIGVRKGDTVTNGQVLVLLDDAEQRARVAEAEGRLANTKAGLTKAELDYERMKKLITNKIETKERED